MVADHQDAWTHYPKEPVGAVFLRRTGPSAVQALQVVCPHAGCFVAYDPQKKSYFCPCHSASFDGDGKRNGSDCPSPRDMDTLEVEAPRPRDLGQLPEVPHRHRSEDCRNMKALIGWIDDRIGLFSAVDRQLDRPLPGGPSLALRASRHAAVRLPRGSDHRTGAVGLV